MSEQGKRVQSRKQEDAAFNKMLIWLVCCVVLEGLTLLLRQLYLNFSNTAAGIGFALALNTFFKVFRFAGAALTIIGFVWFIISLRQKKRGKQLLPSAIVTGVALWLWIVSLLCYNTSFAAEAGMGMLCILPAVVAALAAIFFLYQREFFYNAILCGIGIVALWVYKQIYLNHPRLTYAGFGAAWALLVAAVIIAFLLSRRKGVALGLRILPVKTNYVLIYLTCAVVAVALLVALFLGVTSAYYVMFAVIGWLFCLAVYYTVKLM